MSEYKISLPERVYHLLIKAAKDKGISPIDWIASKLPAPVSDKQPLSKLLDGLVGAINSQNKTHLLSKKNAFADGVAAKLAKQELSRP